MKSLICMFGALLIGVQHGIMFLQILGLIRRDTDDENTGRFI